MYPSPWLALTSAPQVMVHHLAWRAAGNEVPENDSGDVIRHLCGKGRYGPNNPQMCISQACMSAGPQAVNLQAVGCTPVVRCPHCRLFSHQCKHALDGHACTNDLSARLQAQEQGRKIKRITITYEEGPDTVIERED